MIREEDLSLFRVVDDPQAALKHLQEAVPETVEPGATGFARSVTCGRRRDAAAGTAPRGRRDR
jgi:hypothetical protein